jgi:PAS domain S-box-containing protein
VKIIPEDFFSASLAILVTAFIARLLTENLFQRSQQLQKELRERKLAEEKYSNIFENAIDGIFQSTQEGRFLSVNPAMAHMYGFDSPEDMIQNTTDISSQLYVDSNKREALRSLLAEGTRVTGFESLDYRKDGSTFWTSANIQAIRDADENILYYEGTVEDIAERKLAEAALQNNQQRLRAFFNQSLDGFFFSIFDEPQEWENAIDREKILRHIFDNQLYTDVNNALLEQYGITREKFLSLTSSDVFAHDPQQGLHLRRQLFDKGHLRTETHERRGDGAHAWFEGEYVCLYDDQKRITGFFGIQRDITERKKAELEREQLIHELAVKNAESETLRESFAAMVGTFEFSEIIQHILDQIKRVIPYDSASIWKWENNLQKFISGRNLPHIFSDVGFEFVTEETNSALPVIRGQVPYILNNNVQEELADFNEEPHTYVNSWLAIPLKTHGNIIGLIALDGRDKNQFTEHHAELAVAFANQVAIALDNSRLFSELQSELFMREKLIKELESKNTELERFTYTISHDLKSPLVTINGFLGYLKSDTVSGKSDRVLTDIQRIQDAVDKMHLLLKELLELSRIGRIVNPPEKVLFDDLVREALDIVHGQLEAHRVAVQIQPNLPAVQGDRQRLIEVLQNLIDNASKYMGDQPAPSIEIGQHGEEGELLIFFVKDNGIGFNPQYYERIFGLFNKLDAKSEGTGVGLALVKRIIEIHGGRIWAESEVGKGSTFFFTLARGDYSTL